MGLVMVELALLQTDNDVLRWVGFGSRKKGIPRNLDRYPITMNSAAETRWIALSMLRLFFHQSR